MSSGSEQTRATNETNYKPVLRVIPPKWRRRLILGAQSRTDVVGRREKRRTW